MISKGQFLERYRTDITVFFDDARFLSDSTISVLDREADIREAGHYFCPWYYDIAAGHEINASFQKVLGNPEARAAMVKDMGETIPSRRVQIERHVEDFKVKARESLRPFPIATDTTLQATLVLDGNKTLAALHQSWDKTTVIPVAETRGANLCRILPDFRIVGRA